MLTLLSLTLSCNPPPQVTEPTEGDVKEHQRRNHLPCFFRCHECKGMKFSAPTLASVVRHLRTEHGFGQASQLIKMVDSRTDLRRKNV